MYRLFSLLLIVPVLFFSESIANVNKVFDIAKEKINEFVTRDYKPFELSNPRYVQGEKENSKPFYIYTNLIKKIEHSPIIYVYPYSYSTEGVGHTTGAFDKCNILLVLGNERSYQIENKKTDRFSPCLGFESMKIIDINDKTWLVSTVGYMLSQNSEVSDRDDYFIQELYFVDKVKHQFCFVEGDPLMGKVVLDINNLKKNLSQLQAEDVTCLNLR